MSLFSGIGAFEKALTNIGKPYELVNYCELDKYAATAYSAIHNVSEDLNLGDITKIDISLLPSDIDMITHGSSCQDFSIAGRQKGGDEGSGTRSSLMWNTVEIIKYTKPKYVIWENVPNVLSDKHKHNYNKYINTLKRLGYKNYSQLINAKYWGVPQNRERIFVVSIRNDIDKKFEFPISSLERQLNLFNDAIEIKSVVLKNILEDDVDEKYYLSEQYMKELNFDKYKYKHQRLLSRDHGEIKPKKENISNCLYANYYKGIDNHSARTIILELQQIGGIKDGKIKFNNDTYAQGQRIYNSNGIASTLRGEGGGQGGKTGLYYINYKIRRLTPLECFRLMGFDDEDYLKARKKLENKYYNGKNRSDTQLYKCAGNSIVVNVLEYIYKSLF